MRFCRYNKLTIHRPVLAVPLETNTMPPSRRKRIVVFTNEVDLVAIFSVRMYLTSTYSVVIKITVSLIVTCSHFIILQFTSN